MHADQIAQLTVLIINTRKMLLRRGASLNKQHIALAIVMALKNMDSKCLWLSAVSQLHGVDASLLQCHPQNILLNKHVCGFLCHLRDMLN